MSGITDSVFCAGMACAVDLKGKRLTLEEVEVVSFPQAWGSTALGFGGIGGAAVTTAQTTVIIGPAGDAAVYFGKRIAYYIEVPNAKFWEDLRSHSMASCDKCGAYNTKPKEQSK